MAHRRVFTREDEQAFLDTVGRWRRECVAILSRAKPQSPVYKATEGIVAAIDGVAEVVTGDRTRSHQRDMTTPGPELPPSSRPWRTVE